MFAKYKIILANPKSHNYLKIIFFSSSVTEWKKPALNLRKESSFTMFNKQILKFVRPTAYSVLWRHNP